MAATHDPGCVFAQHKATANHGYCDECCGTWCPCNCDVTPRGGPVGVSPMMPETTGKVFGWDCTCVAVSVYDLSGAEEPDHAPDCMSDEAVQHREFMSNPRPSPDDDPLFGSHVNAVRRGHDLLCPQHECDACKWEGEACCRGVCQCDIIAKTRSDERQQAAVRVEKNVLVGMTLLPREVRMVLAAVRGES